MSEGKNNFYYHEVEPEIFEAEKDRSNIDEATSEKKEQRGFEIGKNESFPKERLRNFVFHKESGEQYKMAVQNVGALPELEKNIRQRSGNENYSLGSGAEELVEIFKEKAKVNKDNSFGGKAAEKRAHLLIAGGFVRDYLLGKEPKDIDFATNLEPDEVIKLLISHYLGEEALALPEDEIARRLKEKEISLDFTGKQFAVTRFKIRGEEYEIVTFRQEGEYIDGRRPEWTEPVMNPGEDASRRDFTINALYYNPLSGNVIDYVGGIKDINDENLRFVGDPEERIKEDKLRMMRFARFALRTKFKPGKEDEEVVRKHAPEIKMLAMDKIKKECDAALQSGSAGKFLEILDGLELLKEVMPEIKALQDCEQGPPYHMEGNVFKHTCLVADNIPQDANLRLKWAAITHDIAKPETRTESEVEGKKKVSFKTHEEVGAEKVKGMLARLRFSNDEIKDISWLIKNHQFYYRKILDRFLPAAELSREEAEKRAKKEVVKLILSSNVEIVSDLVDLAAADNYGKLSFGLTPEEDREQSTAEEKIMRDVFKEAKEEIVGNQKYSLTAKLKLGKMIIQYGNIKPGPELGRIKEELEEYLLERNFSTPAEAEELVKQYFVERAGQAEK
jgi:putative nucleotidyltransferase with HDIG domain